MKITFYSYLQICRIDITYNKLEWLLAGKRHREDGPAIMNATGYQSWWVDGKRHRTDGSAIIHSDSSTEYWVNGRQCKKVVC